MNNGCKRWANAAGILAAISVAQTAISVIGVSAVLSDVNWVPVASASVLSGILSMLTSIAGMPEISDNK